jgi:hypothetical protein
MGKGTRGTQHVADHFDTLKQLAATALIEGEQVRTAALVNYGGKVNVNQPPPGLAALGHHDTQLAAGEALVDRYGDHPDVAFPSAKQMALVLTDIRLLVWSRGLSGKPKAFIGEVPVDAIAEVASDPKVGDDRITVYMRSGWEVHLDVTRDDGRGFVAALQYAVEAARPPDEG